MNHAGETRLPGRFWALPMRLLHGAFRGASRGSQDYYSPCTRHVPLTIRESLMIYLFSERFRGVRFALQPVAVFER